MPEQIRVVFERVYVRNDSDWWGSGEFYFIATVDGASVGRRGDIFRAQEGRWIPLPGNQWSAVVDVTRKTEVAVEFHGMESDVGRDDDLGAARHRLQPPWRQARYRGRTRYFVVEWRVELAVGGEFGPHGELEVFACREHSGSQQCTTVAGRPAEHRIEICPVIPTLSATEMPRRPAFPAATRGVDRAIAFTFMSPGLPINTIANPPVIPILSHSAATPNTAARIQITYYHPSTLNFQANDPRLVWDYRPLGSASRPTIAFLPAQGNQPARGLDVFAYGVGNNEGEVELRVSFQGSVLARFRALVRRVRRIVYRANILNAQSGPSPRISPQQVQEHVACANILLRQLGVRLVPDPSTQVWDGATAVSGAPGVFRLRVPHATTRDVDWAMTTAAGRGYIPACALNYNRSPGTGIPYVVNFAYIKSVQAVTHNGQQYRPYGLATDAPANNAGTRISDNGSPSPSWIRPCGILPEGRPTGVTMSLRPVRQRQTGLAACWIRDFANPTDADRYGFVMVHELCHILGLQHRGRANGSTLPDGIGHPIDSNVMYSAEEALGQDFDILQAKAVHQSPVLAT